jgi:heat shock protein HtpX
LPTVFSEERRRRHKLANAAHSLLLLAGMLAILGVCAWTIWGGQGVIWAVIAGGMVLAVTPRAAPELIMRMYQAVPLGPREAPELHQLLHELARRAGLAHVPRLYFIPSRLLNAFAVGQPAAAAIAVTEGLVRTLTPRELAGVLAHELSHVRNNDLWIMSLADLLSRITSLLSWVGQLLLLFNLPVLLVGGYGVPWILVLALVLAPTAMALLQLALSRAREFDADLDAAALTRDPRGLASALAKLDRLQGRFWEEIFLPGRRMPEPSLLRTHPPTAERIARLTALASDEGARPPLPSGGGLWGTAAVAPLAAASGPRWRWPGVWY